MPWWATAAAAPASAWNASSQAWPDIARAVGLAGSQVMSAVVDLWGWRARLRLARGQTITDVIAKIPAIESGLGTFRGAVRVYPTPDDLANRCELRVLDTDPHADAIPWPGPSVTSITEPIDLGPFEDATPCRVLFLRRHALVGGATGSGKSGGLNVLMGNLPPAPTWSSGPSTSRRAWNSALGTVHRPTGHHPERSRRAARRRGGHPRKPAPHCSPQPASASGSHPRTCPRW